MKKEFKKGDLVKLRKGLKVGHKYGSLCRFTLLKSMEFSGYRTIMDTPTDNSCLIGSFYYPLTILTK